MPTSPKHLLSLALLAVTASACSLACNAAPPAGQKSASGQPVAARQSVSEQTSFTPSEPHQIPDPGFGMPYGTLTIPAGWAFNGGVIHGPSCALSGVSPVFAVQSPDGRFGGLSAPHLTTISTTDRNFAARLQQQGCQAIAPADAADFVRTVFLPHLGLQNMRVESVGPSEKLQAELQQFRRQQQQFSALSPDNQFHQQRVSFDAVEVRVAFEARGRQMEGVVAALVQCEDNRVNIPGNPTQSHQCTAHNLRFIFAPAGDLGKFYSSSSISLKENPVWIQHLQQVGNEQLIRNGQQIQQKQKEQIQHGNALMDAQRQRYEAGMATARASAAATHESAQAAAAHNGDYNDYTNTQTGQVTRASNQYNNTYANTGGTVILQTNQAGSPGVDWSLMVPRFK